MMLLTACYAVRAHTRTHAYMAIRASIDTDISVAICLAEAYVTIGASKDIDVSVAVHLAEGGAEGLYCSALTDRQRQ